MKSNFIIGKMNFIVAKLNILQLLMFFCPEWKVVTNSCE